MKSPKVPELFGKTYFQRKVNKSEKKKFVRKREREAESSNFWICITPITPIENESKYKRKVANIILLLWLPTI